LGTHIIRALPVITDYLDRLPVADRVNGLVPWAGRFF